VISLMKSADWANPSTTFRKKESNFKSRDNTEKSVSARRYAISWKCWL